MSFSEDPYAVIIFAARELWKKRRHFLWSVLLSKIWISSSGCHYDLGRGHNYYWVQGGYRPGTQHSPVLQKTSKLPASTYESIWFAKFVEILFVENPQHSPCWHATKRNFETLNWRFLMKIVKCYQNDELRTHIQLHSAAELRRKNELGATPFLC